MAYAPFKLGIFLQFSPDKQNWMIFATIMEERAKNCVKLISSKKEKKRTRTKKA